MELDDLIGCGLAAIMLAPIGYVLLLKRRAVKQFGKAVCPPDIDDIIKNFKKHQFDIDLSQFKMEGTKGSHTNYSRRYEVTGGAWYLDVEFRETILIAYNAKYYSKNAWILNETYGGVLTDTKFIADPDAHSSSADL
jgi:hypothetical protein